MQFTRVKIVCVECTVSKFKRLVIPVRVYLRRGQIVTGLFSDRDP